MVLWVTGTENGSSAKMAKLLMLRGQEQYGIIDIKSIKGDQITQRNKIRVIISEPFHLMA
jgi:hypothetical protein